MATSSSSDTEVSVVNKTGGECTCKCTCTYIKIPPEWAFMTQDEMDVVKANMKQLSPFCTNCLSPYSGERSSEGKLVLHCSRCHHVDVVREDMLREGEDLDLFTGDIISNRFNRILDFEKEFKKIDLHDPYNIDDDYKRLHEMHASILKAISETTNGVRVIVDGQRMAHNMNVYRERQLLQDQLENNTQIRKRNKREREKACLVEISGSVARNNFILEPTSFSIPGNIVSKLKRKGHEGVLNIDKMLLSLGLPNVFIKENMPLYHSRLQIYKNNIKCTFVLSSGSTECETCRCDIKNANVLYIISDDDIMYDEDESPCAAAKENKTEDVRKTAENKTDGMILPRSSELLEILPKKRKKHRQSFKDNTSNESDERTRAQEDLFTMLECLATPQEDSSEIDNLIVSVAESSEMAIAQYSAEKTTDADLDFRRHLGVTNYTNDYEEQKFILGHLCKTKTDDVDKYNIDYVNRVCVEVVDGIRERKIAAKEERRVRIVDYLQLTSTKMCSRVDDVRDDVISQLKIAFQRRIVRNREKKRRQDQILERAYLEGRLSIESSEEEICMILAAEEGDLDIVFASSTNEDDAKTSSVSSANVEDSKIGSVSSANEKDADMVSVSSSKEEDANMVSASSAKEEDARMTSVSSVDEEDTKNIISDQAKEERETEKIVLSKEENK